MSEVSLSIQASMSVMLLRLLESSSLSGVEGAAVGDKTIMPSLPEQMMKGSERPSERLMKAACNGWDGTSVKAGHASIR